MREGGEHAVAPDERVDVGGEDIVAHARALPGVRYGGLRGPLEYPGADEDNAAADEVRQC